MRGTLVDRKGTGDAKDDEPVKDVKITVAKDTGEPVGTSVTDGDGKFVVDIPTGEGNYVAVLQQGKVVVSAAISVPGGE